MTSDSRSFRLKVLGSLVSVILFSFGRVGSVSPLLANEGPGPFDGNYVPDASRRSGEGLLTSPPCLPSESVAFGQGLIVKNSVATFLVGVQPEGALKIRPSKVTGKVGPDGKLEMSKKMLKVTGQFDGPASDTRGHQNSFVGQLILIINDNRSCGYSLYLVHSPHTNP